MRLRVKEALALTEAAGNPVTRKELSQKLFPGVSPAAQQVNMSSLCTGKTRRILPEWIITICETCNCTADFLLGIDKNIKL